jgi:predicted Fe-Mo cluster-binding NifX family protein
MNVAIPILNEQIAPCFDAAKTFQVIIIENDKIVSSRTVKCFAKEGFMRIRLLRLYEINALICNGIKSFYRDQLTAMGITVIPNVNSSKDDAVNLFLQDKLVEYNINQSITQEINLVSHENLVAWAKELFENKGYSVSAYQGDDSFLIDLVAKIKCPVCNKQITIAICCGAQTYNADQEIREFYHTAKTQYDTRVYVYLTNPKIEQSCDEYGIDFLSPEKLSQPVSSGNRSLLPLLSIPVEGHEKAFLSG